VATSIEAEILIVDEVLAVGDLAFQRKCFDRMSQLIKKQKRTVLLVSHNIRQVERLCTRGMMLEQGHLVHDGPARDVCNRFYEFSDAQILSKSDNHENGRWRSLQSSGEIALETISLHRTDGVPVCDVEYNTDFIIRMAFRVHRMVTKPTFGLGIHTTDFIYLATNHIDQKLVPERLEPGLHHVECRVKKLALLPRTYALRVGIAVGERRDTAFYVENALIFSVTAERLNRANPDVSEGFISLETTWRFHDQNGDSELTTSASALMLESR